MQVCCCLLFQPILVLSILILNLQSTEHHHHNTDSFLFSIKQTDKMKFSALVSALFVALAAAACKDGEYSWYVKSIL